MLISSKKTRIVMIALALTLSMVLILGACNSKKRYSGNEANTSNGVSDQIFSDGNVDVIIEGCNFVKEIRAKDGEVATATYPESDGNIYIDFVNK